MRIGAIGLVILATALGACGFHPLYGGDPGTGVGDDLANVEVATIPEAVGQQLHNRLLDLINPGGRPVDPSFILNVDLIESSERLAVAKSELATRANYRLTARYFLRESGGDGVNIVNKLA